MSWLNNLRIAAKLALLVLLLIAISAGVGAFATIRMKTLDDAYSALIADVDTSIVIATEATQNGLVYMGSGYALVSELTDEGNKRLADQARSAKHDYSSKMAMVLRNVPQQAMVVQPAKTKFEEAFAHCDPAVEFAATTVTPQDNLKAAARLRAECEPFIGAAIVEQRKAVDSLSRFALKASGELTDVAWETIYATLTILVMGIVVGLSAGAFVGIKGLSQPIARLKTTMAYFADNDLDHEVPGIARRDELGEMARTVEVFKVNGLDVARMRSEQQAGEVRIARQRKDDMHKLADAFEATVGEIIETVSSASTELEASARTLTSTAERSEQLAATVSAASEEASTNVQSVASATEEMASSVVEISRQVQDSARIAGEAVEQAGATNQQIAMLAKSADRIGDVVELINTIAGQTNLLALNATIEAARAGEAGRGFAVVAAEVKALAEQTAKATGEISQQVSGMQTATAQSVEAIREIGVTIRRMSEIASTIAASVEEQGAATQEISRNVQHAAQGTSAVSANITDVQRGATETGSASTQVLSAAQMLSQDSNRLKSEVSNFLATVRSA